MERRWMLGLLALALLGVSGSDAADNGVVLMPLSGSSAMVGQGLGRFHAGRAQWTLEGGLAKGYLSVALAVSTDFDGDGRPEWVLTAPRAPAKRPEVGKVWVVSPDMNTRSLQVRWSWSPPLGTPQRAGSEVAAGDFNGDGFADLAVSTDAGEVVVFHGGRNHLSQQPVWRQKGAKSRSGFGDSLVACDVNRDGFADVLTGETGWDGGRGRMLVFAGGTNGLAAQSSPLWQVQGTSVNEHFGECIAVLDANGDGQLDLAVSAPYCAGPAGRLCGEVRLFLGTNGGFAERPVWVTTGRKATLGFGETLCALGDLDRDGCEELAVSGYGFNPQQESGTEGEVSIYYGQPDGLASQPRWRKTGSARGTLFGISITGVGDVNGDGWRDVLIGSVGESEADEPAFRGLAELYLGGTNGLPRESSWFFGNVGSRTWTGKYLSAMGDIDGDGLADFAVLSPNFSPVAVGASAGRLDLFFGHRQRYGAGEIFPCDAANAQPYAVALADFKRQQEAVVRTETAARRAGWLVWLAAGLGVAVLGVLGLGRWQRIRVARLAAEESAVRERARIARDLHDGVGSELHGLQRLTEALNRVPEGSVEAQRCREELLAAAHTLGGSMNQLLWSVKPENDTLRNLINFLANYAPSILRPNGIGCELNLPSALPAYPLRGDTRQHLFLAVNEALHNVVKHSQARQVWLRVAWTEHWLEIVVEDDGCGFATPSPRAGGGNGLPNLRERMTAMRGNAEVAAREGGGRRLTLRVPLPPNVG